MLDKADEQSDAFKEHERPHVASIILGAKNEVYVIVESLPPVSYGNVSRGEVSPVVGVRTQFIGV